MASGLSTESIRGQMAWADMAHSSWVALGKLFFDNSVITKCYSARGSLGDIAVRI